jgi:hypothetical protein
LENALATRKTSAGKSAAKVAAKPSRTAGAPETAKKPKTTVKAQPAATAAVKKAQPAPAPVKAAPPAAKAAKVTKPRTVKAVVVPPPPPPFVSSFEVGEAVSHKTFGGGKVTEIDGERLTIDFAKIGTKVIIDSFIQSAKKR